MVKLEYLNFRFLKSLEVTQKSWICVLPQYLLAGKFSPLLKNAISSSIK